MQPFSPAAEASPRSITALLWLLPGCCLVVRNTESPGSTADTLAPCHTNHRLLFIGLTVWLLVSPKVPAEGQRTTQYHFWVLSTTLPRVIMVCPHHGRLAVKACLPSVALRQRLTFMETTSLRSEIDPNRYAVTASSFPKFLPNKTYWETVGVHAVFCLPWEPEILALQPWIHGSNN